MVSAVVEHCSFSNTKHSVLNKVKKNDKHKNKQNSCRIYKTTNKTAETSTQNSKFPNTKNNL